jgi:serine protease Do
MDDFMNGSNNNARENDMTNRINSERLNNDINDTEDSKVNVSSDNGNIQQNDAILNTLGNAAESIEQKDFILVPSSENDSTKNVNEAFQTAQPGQTDAAAHDQNTIPMNSAQTADRPDTAGPQQRSAQYTDYSSGTSQNTSYQIPQQNFGPASAPQQNPARTSQQSNQNYYSESIKKTKSKKTGLGQLILVAVISAFLGGGVVFAAGAFLTPVIQPYINDMLGIESKEASSANSQSEVYKKVEITQSTNPAEAIAEKVSPSIVGIRVTAKSQSFSFFDLGQEDGVGEGSGVIIREDGYILTNNHVVSNALADNSNKLNEGSKIEVILPSNKEKSYVATVVGCDSKTDIAVLKIEATGLPAAELGDSDKVKSGELAIAIGNPGGLDYMGSVTSGIISGINRTIKMENGQTLKLLQTDAAINPGNSGGALVNSEGQVIGINTVKIAATGYEGIGFAIPINEANEIAESLMEYSYVKGRPYLGISIDQRFNEDVAKAYNVPNGLLVYDVVPLSCSYKAGIKSGDIITKFDGVKVTQFSELETQKQKHKPGDSVEIELYRDGKTITVTVVLDEEKNAN